MPLLHPSYSSCLEVSYHACCRWWCLTHTSSMSSPSTSIPKMGVLLTSSSTHCLPLPSYCCLSRFQNFGCCGLSTPKSNEVTSCCVPAVMHLTPLLRYPSESDPIAAPTIIDPSAFHVSWGWNGMGLVRNGIPPKRKSKPQRRSGEHTAAPTQRARGAEKELSPRTEERRNGER